AGGPHRRHREQLLPDLLPARRFLGHALWRLGHALLDGAGLGRLLLVPDSRPEGISTDRWRLDRARHSQPVLLPGGDRGEPFRYGKPPPGVALSEAGRDARRNQPETGAGPGRRPALGAAGGARTTLRRARPRNPQPAGGDRGLG